MCPTTPTWPARVTLLPIFVLPAIPTCATITESSPISTLWAICTKLSIFVPLPITVSPNVALSIVTHAPISTSSSILTIPTCGILWKLLPSFANPKPSLPITALQCTITRLPTEQPSLTDTLEYSTVSSPTRAPLPI